VRDRLDPLPGVLGVDVEADSRAEDGVTGLDAPAGRIVSVDGRRATGLRAVWGTEARGVF